LHAPASIAGQLGAGEVYRSPGGEHAFLEDLARLETPGRGRAHRDRERDQAAELIAPRSREARMPGIAVLIDPDVVEAHALVALRPTLEPAIAFVTESVSPTVIELLEESDWRIVTVRRPNEIASAWTSAWRDARGGAAQRSGAGRAR
jgi:hypothetical protein